MPQRGVRGKTITREILRNALRKSLGAAMSSILEVLVGVIASGREPTPEECGCSADTMALIMGCDAFKAAVIRRQQELASGN